ncbi:MAG: SdpI family protein [Firmicutes bacterium]|nr:SdpI family protein [Bacillota bacterium]
MQFWFFMLMMSLLIPVSMIVFGRLFIRSAPKKINSVFGYRTSMSMKNKETWEFAHHYCGKLWYAIGWPMLIITFGIMLLLINEPTGVIGSVGAVLSVVQIIIMLGTIIPVERALKQTFAKNGKRKR